MSTIARVDPQLLRELAGQAGTCAADVGDLAGPASPDPAALGHVGLAEAIDALDRSWDDAVGELQAQLVQASIFLGNTAIAWLDLDAQLAGDA